MSHALAFVFMGITAEAVASTAPDAVGGNVADSATVVPIRVRMR